MEYSAQLRPWPRLFLFLQAKENHLFWFKVLLFGLFRNYMLLKAKFTVFKENIFTNQVGRRGCYTRCVKLV
jgi:hypothetical protein